MWLWTVKFVAKFISQIALNIVAYETFSANLQDKKEL